MTVADRVNLRVKSGKMGSGKVGSGKMGGKVAADENWKSLDGNFGFVTQKRTAFIQPRH